MPPSATGSLLSPLSAPLCTASGSCSPVRFSPPNRAGVGLRGCCSSRTQYVRYANYRGRRKILHLCWRSPLRPLLGHSSVVFFFKGRRLPGSLLDVLGWCLSSTCGGGGRSPYASPQPTRSAVAATPLNRASLRPSVRQRFIHLLAHLLMSNPSVRAVFRRHPSWRLQR